ncbi:hypothetical protein [Candidatus Stoquefichus massiliensis]|uniref:hypothetical protein n=1 Tax=Candidatus Stoquefichus massiliensis TaxID=1470350 RepID=UPI000485CF3A|nr:hypothetical protein [Candidatus Stoquefichus massiliensis]
MSEKLKDFELGLVGSEGNEGEPSPMSLTWVTTSSGYCIEATVSLFTASSQIITGLTTGSNYTESSDC